jgi:hypothetical protein
MAGKRQHYIPRFLQRGFLSSDTEDAERTWLHRRGAEARLVGIRDVGVHENFYSKISADGLATLDDLITAIESERGRDLSLLKKSPIGSAIDPQVAARLTTHLTLRTAYLRSVFERGVAQVVDEAVEFMADAESVRRYLQVDEILRTKKSPSIVDEVLQRLPDGLLPAHRPLAERMLAYFVREHFDAMYEEFGSTASQLFSEVAGNIATVIRDSHNKALQEMDQTLWENGLSKLNWRICSVVGAVLPDCVALTREAGHDFAPLLLSDRKKVDLVVLPIAHDRLLVGSAVLNAEIAVASINAASASCSDSFFISSCARDADGLLHLIGQRSARVIAASVNEAISSLRGEAGFVVRETRIARHRFKTDSSPLSSFSLTCLGFADSESIARLGDVLRTIVYEVGREMPLTALDGFTFASDYEAAISEVDRGDPSLGPDQSHPRTYGRAVAKCVRVVRDGESKDRIVVDAIIAQHLLSDVENDRAYAVHVVVDLLAKVAHTVLYRVAIDEAGDKTTDAVLKLLHQTVSSAAVSYFGAKTSAFADHMAGERYATLFRDSLSTAGTAVKKARLTYESSGDMDEFLEVVLPQISFVLDHAAEWLGHRDGLPIDESFPGSSLQNEVKPLGLDLWLELFGRDLQRLYRADGQFTSRNILALGKHAERILWTFQVFPWPLENGSVYVSVPPTPLDVKSSGESA